MVILDFGSGETCQNSRLEALKMIKEMDNVNSGKRRIVIKWQLFNTVPKAGGKTVTPLDRDVFDYAYRLAAKMGYETTASVFDIPSLKFLIDNYSVPFVKIACRQSIYELLLPKIPNSVLALVSVPSPFTTWDFRLSMISDNIDFLCCVPEYPANWVKYATLFGGFLSVGISDHTDNFELFHKYKPTRYEKHFKLPDSKGLDNGPWAMTPEQLEGIL